MSCFYKAVKLSCVVLRRCAICSCVLYITHYSDKSTSIAVFATDNSMLSAWSTWVMVWMCSARNWHAARQLTATRHLPLSSRMTFLAAQCRASTRSALQLPVVVSYLCWNFFNMFSQSRIVMILSWLFITLYTLSVEVWALKWMTKSAQLCTA